MLTLWGRRSSSNVQAVMWCIAELNLAVDRIDAGLNYGVNNTAEYMKMNPNGKIPTLRDGNNAPIWESAAIIRYLAENYSNGVFWPDDQCKKAHVDMWAEWSKLNVAGRFTGPVFWQAVRVPEERRDIKALHQSIRTFETQLAIAEAKLSCSEFLAGDSFTVADIQFGHILYRYYDIDIVRCDGLENIARYYNALVKRPEYKEHVMVSYEELRDTL